MNNNELKKDDIFWIDKIYRKFELPTFDYFYKSNYADIKTTILFETPKLENYAIGLHSEIYYFENDGMKLMKLREPEPLYESTEKIEYIKIISEKLYLITSSHITSKKVVLTLNEFVEISNKLIVSRFYKIYLESGKGINLEFLKCYNNNVDIPLIVFRNKNENKIYYFHPDDVLKNILEVSFYEINETIEIYGYAQFWNKILFHFNSGFKVYDMYGKKEGRKLILDYNQIVEHSKIRYILLYNFIDEYPKLIPNRKKEDLDLQIFLVITDSKVFGFKGVYLDKTEKKIMDPDKMKLSFTENVTTFGFPFNLNIDSIRFLNSFIVYSTINGNLNVGDYKTWDNNLPALEGHSNS